MAQVILHGQDSLCGRTRAILATACDSTLEVFASGQVIKHASAYSQAGLSRSPIDGSECV